MVVAHPSCAWGEVPRKKTHVVSWVGSCDKLISGCNWFWHETEWREIPVMILKLAQYRWQLLVLDWVLSRSR